MVNACILLMLYQKVGLFYGKEDLYNQPHKEKIPLKRWSYKKQHLLNKGKAIKLTCHQNLPYAYFRSCIQDNMPNDEHWFVHLNIIVLIILIKGEYTSNMVIGVLALMRKGSQYWPSLKMLKLLLWLMLICTYRYTGIINIYGGSMWVFYFVRCPTRKITSSMHYETDL